MNFELNTQFNKPKQAEQEKGSEKSRLLNVLEKSEGEMLKGIGQSEKSKNFAKAVRAITVALTFLNSAPVLAQSENMAPQAWEMYKDRTGKSELQNKEIEKNIENFGIEGLRMGRVSQARSERGIHYQRGVYLNGEHLGDIIYYDGRVVDTTFFLDSVHQILKASGFPDRFAPDEK